MDHTPQEIIALLQSKNRCLERLMEATRQFLQAPLETLVIDQGEKNTPLAVYENERAGVIQTLELHDRRINTLIGEMKPEDKTEEVMSAVKAELAQNERMIISIFNADDIVFARIRDAQSQISKMLAENRKSKEILSKFKSGTTATGDGMDKTL